MLDALIHRKLRGSLRESMRGRRYPELQEDLITSMVFGPLRFIPTDSAWHIIKLLLLNEKQAEVFQPTEHKLIFWPNLKLDDGKTIVQPDLVFVFSSASDRKICAVEVKWNAKLSDKQLQRQREAVRRKWGAGAIQILLTKNQVNDGVGRDQIEETKCNIETWYGMMEKLKSQSGIESDTHVNYWMNQVLELFEVLGIGSFSRFIDKIDIPSIAPVLAWCIESWRIIDSSKARHLDGHSTAKALQWRLML